MIDDQKNTSAAMNKQFAAALAEEAEEDEDEEEDQDEDEDGKNSAWEALGCLLCVVLLWNASGGS